MKKRIYIMLLFMFFFIFTSTTPVFATEVLNEENINQTIENYVEKNNVDKSVHQITSKIKQVDETVQETKESQAQKGKYTIKDLLVAIGFLCVYIYYFCIVKVDTRTTKLPSDKYKLFKKKKSKDSLPDDVSNDDAIL